MTQFSNKFKKPCFWPIFPIFGTKKIFLENPALSRTTSYEFLATCQNLEKINLTIQRKRLDRRKDGRTEGQTLFYRTLPATAGGIKRSTKNYNYKVFILYFYILWAFFSSNHENNNNNKENIKHVFLTIGKLLSCCGVRERISRLSFSKSGARK